MKNSLTSVPESLTNDAEFFEDIYYKLDAFEVVAHQILRSDHLNADDFNKYVVANAFRLMGRGSAVAPLLCDIAVQMWWEKREIERNAKKQMKTYVMHDKTSGLYKIGRTKLDNVNDRVKQLSQPHPSLRIVQVFEHQGDIESKLHSHFQAKRVSGEWFKLTDKDIKSLKRLAGELAMM